jgi:hypothetical protein
LAIDEGCTSIDDHLDCQSNHKYLEASLFIESKKGISIKKVFKELFMSMKIDKLEFLSELYKLTLKKLSLFLPIIFS